jgi:crotonobetainyl-CoA:carnitine CoA-transferase CaiB-like acyl-CoA transferase
LPTLPLAFSSGRLELRLQPPKVGEHSVEVLQDLGYADAQIEQLKREGIVGC